MTKRRRWYVIRSKAHQELRVLEQLVERAGFEAYFPRIQVAAPDSTSKAGKVKPLFPRYLFAKLLLPEEWKLITYTRGVSNILGDWKCPAFVEDEVLEAIREREHDKDRIINYYQFKPSEKVYIHSGPMKDLQGIFERYVDEEGRVRILLSLIGYQASVELRAEQLEKL